MRQELYSNKEGEGINITSLIGRLRRNWWAFAATIVFAFIVSWVILRYQASVYLIESSIVLRDDSNRKLGAENLIKGMELFSFWNNLENEMAILKSFKLVNKALQNSGLETSYFSKGKFRKVERYQNFPFQVELDTSHWQLAKLPFQIEILTDETYRIQLSGKEYNLYHPGKRTSSEKIKRSISIQKEGRFGEPFESEYFSFTLTRTEFDSTAIRSSDQLSFAINDLNSLTHHYISKLDISPLNKDASIINIGIKGELIAKEKKILDQLGYSYIHHNLTQKNLVAINTVDFISQQLSELDVELVGAESKLKEFRSMRQQLDPQFASELVFKELEELSEYKATLLLKSNYYDYLASSLKNKANLSGLISPSTLNIDDELLNNQIKTITELYSEKAGQEYFANTENPGLEIILLKIDQSHEILKKNVDNIIEATRIALDELEERENLNREKVAQLPSQQRDLVRIERKFNHLDQMHGYLQQKQAEAKIALASNTADNYVLDRARVIGSGPVFPRKGVIYLLAILLALALPFLVFLVKEAMDDTIHLKSQIPYSPDIPLLGLIGHSQNSIFFPMGSNPHSPVSEAFRLLRVELQRVANKSTGNIIGITSHRRNEGKSFCTLNLATALAHAGFKTLIVEIDLRKAGSLNWLSLKYNEGQKGLSSYMEGECSPEECIFSTKIERLDVLPGGPMSEYPTEILRPNKIQKLIQEVSKQYDYVLLDGPPVSMIADYLLFANRVDHHLLIARCGVTTKDNLIDLFSMPFLGSSDNRHFVLNDFYKWDNKQYNYGYARVQDSWWKKPIKLLRPPLKSIH